MNIEIPNELKRFIEQRVKLDNYCLPHFYPQIDSFDKFQAGYRYNGLTNESLIGENYGDWKESWFVICSAYANDPFFVDFNEEKEQYPVYFAFHSTGKWMPMKVAESIVEFSKQLEILKSIENGTENRQPELEEKFDIKEEFWKNVYDEYEDYEE